ncbi:uncharacterized protein CIMG_06693 [Coccidioides immitis RS]|uniref:Uncharacterized protein n=3 Tax=Coccidioides immitis TaxID=5501 RepID=A0A0E1RW40_COCIM|nr:uncharacterized protein CIMG_06693 [Coccidioides immitis RS]EAS31214.1 hypothetical protein CIMG_06693 [Coccidioides immitis RS]KMU74811.1 hypothetical protein CISG_00741 [Coccidioides immitis RMSCC 3703]KMU83346.1 hypothetical protein CIHG_01128 [Coccidioides immitis H538.4]
MERLPCGPFWSSSLHGEAGTQRAFGTRRAISDELSFDPLLSRKSGGETNLPTPSEVFTLPVQSKSTDRNLPWLGLELPRRGQPRAACLFQAPNFKLSSFLNWYAPPNRTPSGLSIFRNNYPSRAKQDWD